VKCDEGAYFTVVRETKELCCRGSGQTGGTRNQILLILLCLDTNYLQAEEKSAHRKYYYL